MRISDWSSDVCSSDLLRRRRALPALANRQGLDLGHAAPRVRRGLEPPLERGGRSPFLRPLPRCYRRPGHPSKTFTSAGPCCADNRGMDGEISLCNPDARRQLCSILFLGLPVRRPGVPCIGRSEEHTSELQSLMRISYAVFCLTKKNTHDQ